MLNFYVLHMKQIQYYMPTIIKNTCLFIFIFNLFLFLFSYNLKSVNDYTITAFPCLFKLFKKLWCNNIFFSKWNVLGINTTISRGKLHFHQLLLISVYLNLFYMWQYFKAMYNQGNCLHYINSLSNERIWFNMYKIDQNKRPHLQ